MNELEDWLNRGALDATQEAREGYTGPEPRGEVSDYWRECFDHEHPELIALLAQRERCVESRLNGYYTEWTAIHALQSAAADEERAKSLNGPVRVRKAVSQ